MSIEAMTAVWTNEGIERRDLTVALALADHADAEGSCYPSIDRIAQKARVSRRTVIYAIERLARAGVVAVEKNAGPRGSNLYRIGGCKTCTRAKSAPVQNEVQDLHPNRKESPVISIPTARAREEDSMHPWPIALYVERHGLPPPLLWYNAIATRVTDRDVWTAVLDEWDQSGYRLQNVAGLLEHYERSARVLGGGKGAPKDAMTWEEMQAHAKKNRLTPVADYLQADDTDARGRPKWRPKA
jgi:hypothetical protein